MYIKFCFYFCHTHHSQLYIYAIWSNWNHSVSQCPFVKRSSTATSHSTLDLKRTQLQNNKICQSTKKQKTKKGKFHKNKTTPPTTSHHHHHISTPPLTFGFLVHPINVRFRIKQRWQVRFVHSGNLFHPHVLRKTDAPLRRRRRRPRSWLGTIEQTTC